MPSSKVGVLEQVIDEQVCIDGAWYNGSAITKFIPKQTGVQVEYSEDGSGNLLFVRAQRNFTPKNTAGGSTYTPYPSKGGYKKSTYKDNSKSIVKQVLFKAAIAIWQTQGGLSEEDTYKAIDVIYKTLVETYLTELTS